MDVDAPLFDRDIGESSEDEDWRFQVSDQVSFSWDVY